MTDLSDKLSAYLDGELNDEETRQVDAWLERDPAAQAQLEALMQVDTLTRDVFDGLLRDPVPLAVAQTIKNAPMPEAPIARRPIWGSIAAGLAILMIGAAGGYVLGGQNAPQQTAGWLNDIADYHAVYAAQDRHLVEVGADQSDHIQVWLGKTVGVPFTIPDLSAHGLSFEGGRLLVANGAPVAQLMYRDSGGQVVALCLQRNERAIDGLRQQTIDGFDFVSWWANGTSYVVIGQQGSNGLTDIAETAAQLI